MRPSIKYLEDAFARIDDAHRADLIERKAKLEQRVSQMLLDESALAPEHLIGAREGFRLAQSLMLDFVIPGIFPESTACSMDEQSASTNAVVKEYIDAKVDYETARHENSLHDEHDYTPSSEQRRLEAAERDFNALDRR